MFTNESTAAQFEPVPGFEQDRTVNLIGKIGSKNVSNLTPEEAQMLIDNGVNYIRPKAQATVPVPEAVAAIATPEPEKKSDVENEQ